MKQKFLLFNISLLFLISYGCGPQEVKNKPLESTYIAINGLDTAWAQLSIGRESFKGQCKIKYHNSYTDSGDVRGVIKGDTLLGDFHYLHYGVKWKRIAIALLKKDSQLIMGEGKQSVFLDIPFFAPENPVKYDSVKFVFRKTDAL